MKTKVQTWCCAGMLALSSFQVMAIETDQFLVADVELKDASPLINKYINEKMQLAVTKANRKDKKSSHCQELASDVFTEILGRFAISKISRYAEDSQDIERFPGDQLSMGQYMELSIYQSAKFPINMVGLSHTINIGGIYVGTDKLGHFALLGRNYYNRYRKYLGRYKDSKTAQRKSMLKGIRQEVSLLGYTLGGVLSYADLEANYQGLRFGIEMCQGDDAYLQYKNQNWQLNPDRIFDIRNYINPKMDESYNRSFWRPSLWHKIKDDIQSVYCPMLASTRYQQRIADYQRIQTTSFNDEVMEQFLQDRPKFDRRQQEMNCP